MNITRMYYCFCILLLITSIISNAMEIETTPQFKVKPPKPLIKATVYFDLKYPTFYATKEEIEYLNRRGISTPVQPIVRKVARAIVKENAPTSNWPEELNWLDRAPYAIARYYSERLKTKPPIKLVKEGNLTLQLDRACLKGKKIYECCSFPTILPVELVFNCVNGSRISLKINGFPTEITFQGQRDLYAEQQKALLYFFDHPSYFLTEKETQELIETQLLQEVIVPKVSIYYDPLSQQEIDVSIDTIKYVHGPKGCAHEDDFVKSLVKTKMPTDKSIFKNLVHRELTGSFK